MDLRQLRYFLAIAEERSISRAAERLCVAQPSLSQHVMRLEADLGVTLLVRSSRGVSTTEAGERLLEHARSLLRAVEAAREDVRTLGAQTRGMVAVGLPSSTSMVLAVPLAEAVREALPDVTLRTMEAMSGHVQDWLEDGAIDLGILYNASGIRHMAVQELMTEDLYLIQSPKACPSATVADGVARRSVALADVSALPLVLPGRPHGLRELVDRYARATAVPLTVAVEMDALTQIKALVARGSVATVLALAAVRQELARGELIAVPIAEPAIRRTVSLVRNPSRTSTRASRAVERLMIEEVVGLVQRGVWHGRLAPALLTEARRSP